MYNMVQRHRYKIVWCNRYFQPKSENHVAYKYQGFIVEPSAGKDEFKGIHSEKYLLNPRFF